MESSASVFFKQIFISFLFVMMLSGGRSHGQGAVFTFAYNVSPVNVHHYNKIIDRYNETRPWLTKGMRHISMLKGFDFGMGGLFGGVFDFDTHYIVRRATVSATGVVPGGTESQRILRLRAHSLTTFYGLRIPLKSDKLLYVAGYNLALAFTSSATKAAETTAIEDAKFEGFNHGLILTSGPYLKVFYAPGGGIAFSFRVSHESYSRELEFGNVNYIINPDTYENHPYSQQSRIRHLSFSVGLALLNMGD